MNDAFGNLRNRTIPWRSFILLTALFFAATHQWASSVLITDPDRMTRPLVHVEEGGLPRRIAFLTLGAFGVASLLSRRRSKLNPRGSLAWLILFYLVWVSLSVAWTDDMAFTFRRLVVFWVFSLGAAGAAARFSVRDTVLLTFISSLVYLAIGVGAEVALHTLRPFAGEYRFSGTMHPNMQGTNCALLLLSSLAIADFSKRRRKVLFAVALFALVFLVLTKSRTSFAGGLLAVTVFWSFLSKSSRMMLVVVALVFTICLVFLLFGDAVFPLLQYGILLGQDVETAPTLTGRIPLWADSASYISKHPLTGYGFNSFWSSRRMDEIADRQGWIAPTSHSVYIELLLNVGLVGLVTFVAIIGAGIRRSAKYYRISGDIGYAFVCAFLWFCMLEGLLETGVVDPALMSFICMVVLVKLGFGQLESRHHPRAAPPGNEAPKSDEAVFHAYTTRGNRVVGSAAPCDCRSK